MTELLFREDAYQAEATARIVAVTDTGGLVLDRTVFYPRGGGQPGDRGQISWDGGALEIADTVKGEGDQVVLVAAAPDTLPPVGTEVIQRLDWPARLAHMRIHTALHLLSVVIPRPVTGGAIGAGKGRLDFDMPEAPADKAALEAALNTLIERDLAVTERWITDEDLAARPELVKTMSVQPPRGQGRVRLVRIGTEGDQVDLQPCGGTHVARTGEIGPVRFGKVEKKGKQNRRVTLHLEQ